MCIKVITWEFGDDVFVMSDSILDWQELVGIEDKSRIASAGLTEVKELDITHAIVN
jgi:hypothetical protein